MNELKKTLLESHFVNLDDLMGNFILFLLIIGGGKKDTKVSSFSTLSSVPKSYMNNNYPYDSNIYQQRY